ncbi:amino acid ABC transporter permease [Leifsonia poae]|uniref:amino acid ABC transporter permease n=1 Tax=Leifsonia poae TaxID=110933 RepID=UPI001CBFF91D|nr:amino acid ABC transporter permease [Leifsonia poae]
MIDTRLPEAVAPSRPPSAEKRIFVRRRHLSWWIAGIVFALVAATFVDFLVGNPRWDWAVVGQYLFRADVLRGLASTAMLTVISAVTGLLMGGIVAYLRMSSNPVLRWVGALYIWIVRAIPALVILLFIFFAAALLPVFAIGVPHFGPTLIAFDTNKLISQFSAAIIGLTIIQGAYVGEIYRGGILSVARGQFDAATAIGMTRTKAMFRIILPQAVRVIIPPLGNELITLFKNTSLVYVIGYTELLTTVQLIYSQTYQTIPLLLVACIWYLVITSIGMIGQHLLERRFGRGFRVTKKAVAPWKLKKTEAAQ